MKLVSSSKFRVNGHYLVLALLVFVVAANLAPYFHPLPRRDSGVYLYIGQQILDGHLPYRDLWDHKGPLIFYINALGVWLTPGTLWGIWGVQWALLSGTVFMGYFVMQRAWGKAAALFGSVFWGVHLYAVLGGGNHVEEYSLFFEFLALMLFWQAEKTQTHYWFEGGMGVTVALSFLLRPNNLGMGAAIGAFLLLRAFFVAPRRRAWFRLGAMAVGAGVTLAGVVAFFAAQGGLGDFVSAALMYNLRYSLTTPFARGEVFLTGMAYLPALVMVAFAAWWVGVINFWHFSQLSKAQTALLGVSLLNLPLAIALSLFSGRDYAHYFMSWLPSLGLLSGFFAYQVQAFIPAGEASPAQSRGVGGTSWVYALTLTCALYPLSGLLPSAVTLATVVGRARAFPPPNVLAEPEGVYVDFILQNTAPDETVLIWGNELMYNFLTDRDAPSKFIYQYPFVTPNYATEAMTREFLNDLIEKRPLIIDSAVSNPTLPFIASKEWDNFPQMQEVIAYIRTHYEITTYLGPQAWPVWVYTETP